MTKQNEIWSLMAKTIFGEATPLEMQQLEEMLKAHPELQQQFGFLTGVLTQEDRRKEHSTHNRAAGKINEILRKANASQQNRPAVVSIFKKYIPPAAAVILILTVAGWFLLHNISNRNTAKTHRQAALVTQKGSRSQIVLPDGSKVWLNAGSELVYNNNFKGTTREVTLEGEAFFDIAKNMAKPFIVHAGSINIKVLGTAFNVKAYKDEENVETTLYRGLVNILGVGNRNFKPITLYPNQKITVPGTILQNQTLPVVYNAAPRAGTHSIVIQQLDSTRPEPQRIETAWMHNRLEFRGDNFEELARKLERWYDVKIVFGDAAVKQLNFNGSFENENIEQALRALATANSFFYKIQHHEIFISTTP